MKYKLGQKYYFVVRGWIESAVLHSVTITLDMGGIYSEECYLDVTGAEITIVNNKEVSETTRLLFKTEKQAIDYQIRVLKGMKK